MYNEGASFPTSAEADMLHHDLSIIHTEADPTILPNHSWVSFDIGAGGTYFNYDYAYANLSVLSAYEVGFAFVCPPSSGMSMGLMGILTELGHTPQYSCGACTAIALSNNDDWPYFNRIAISDAFLATIVSQMMVRYGWTQCAALYATEPWAQGLYDRFE